MSQNALTEIVSNNYAKIKNLRDKGIDPFPHRFTVTHKIAEARKLPAETHVVCAGRMMLMRVMGKASFGQIKDGTGKIQFYVKKDVVGEEAYDIFRKNNNVGDFLGVEGSLWCGSRGISGHYVRRSEYGMGGGQHRNCGAHDQRRCVMDSAAAGYRRRFLRRRLYLARLCIFRRG